MVVSCLCFYAQQFRERVLPNIQKLVSADYVRSLHESGQDVRTHLINARMYGFCLSCSTSMLCCFSWNLS